MILPTKTPNDLATLELARQEARVALALARKDRQRAERLLSSGAVPARRVDEAVAAEQTADARLQAAEARLSQFESSRAADPVSLGAKLFAIRAPIAGLVEAVKVSPSAIVKSGEPLFQIVDLDTVYVAAIVPESEFPRMRSLGGAELEVPGLDIPRRLTRLVHIGRVVDAPSRTFPVTYEVDNRDRRLAINQTVYVRIFTSTAASHLAVPESALVDDNGTPVVYVQSSGESFLRRPVKLGARAAGYVQILQGLTLGDRIVTRGAHLIRLASLSQQVPAHGHVH
jgi:RND family efflux transporter MFP subunit